MRLMPAPDSNRTIWPITPLGFARGASLLRHAAQAVRGVVAFTLASCLALGSEAYAASFAGPALVIARPSRPEALRLFGGQTVAVPVLVHALKVEGINLRAQLVQLTSNLSVPIGAELEVPLPSNPSPHSGIELDLSVPLPAVQRETNFELRVRSRRGHDKPWHAAGRIALRVYPGDLLDSVRVWAKSHPLRVRYGNGSLQRFLRRQRIPVVADGKAEGFHDGPGVSLFAGASALRKHKRFPLPEGEAIVLFTERESEPPRLFIERTDRGTTVSVEIRLLDRLATDPLAQKIFLEVFQLLHEERPLVKGDIQ